MYKHINKVVILLGHLFSLCDKWKFLLNLKTLHSASDPPKHLNTILFVFVFFSHYMSVLECEKYFLFTYL